MKVYKLVEESLRDYAKCRDSDRYLMLVIWHRLGFELTAQQRALFMGLPSPESIRRIRQKIQEQGRYPASEAVRQKRKLKSMIVQQQIPSRTYQKVEDVLTEQVNLL